jgi:hypothetical protein
MRLYFSLTSSRLITAPSYNTPLSKLSFKRGDAVTLDLTIYVGVTATELEPGSEIIFALKKTLDGDALAIADNWTLADGIYSAKFNTNTTELIAEMGGEDSIELLGELSTSPNGDDWTSSQTLTVTVENDLIKGNEETPETVATRRVRQVAADRVIEDDDLGALVVLNGYELTLTAGVLSKGGTFAVMGAGTLAGALGAITVGADSMLMFSYDLVADTFANTDWLPEVLEVDAVQLSDTDGLILPD